MRIVRATGIKHAHEYSRSKIALSSSFSFLFFYNLFFSHFFILWLEIMLLGTEVKVGSKYQ